MTTKPPSSRLAASGQADDPSDQITKEHNDEDDDGQDDITVDPSHDVTVEATEDVTTEAASHTPLPSLRPGGTAGGTPAPAPRAPTLLGVPIQSLPLPGVTAASLQDQGDGLGEDATRTIDYNEEITVLAPPAPGDPLAALDALDAFDRPSITDDDEEETKVEPAESAMKAAASIDDVTTALSAQASLEREKALRRTLPSSAPSDDLEFADPDAEDEEQEQLEEEESLDDALSDEDEVISAGGETEDEEEEVISAGGAIEEEADDDDDDGAGDGVATATFMKPVDSTGLSGLLNPRRPPTGGRDGFGSRLPTPYSQASSVPAPATSPFASRLGPAPTGSPYRPTATPMTAIQIPPPSAEAATASEPGFFGREVKMKGGALVILSLGIFIAGFGSHAWFGSGSPPARPAVAAKPTPAAPTAPVVIPVAPGPTTPPAEAKPATTPVEAAKSAPTIADLPAGGPSEKPAGTETPEANLWKPATKKKPVQKAALVDPLADDAAKSAPKPAVATTPKPKPAEPAVAAATPKPTVAATPKPAAGKAKKPTKVWVDPFAN